MHVDIARELDIAITHNNPTKEEHKNKCKYNKDNSVLLVWTDGSADASKKSVGYAVWWASEHPLNYSRRMNYPTNTNNEAELTAILHALTVVPVEQSLEIITDSEIAVKVCTALQRANSVTLSALTRRDSATTARVKRAIWKRLSERQKTRRSTTTTTFTHVYSHLLDRNHKMTAEEHKRKLDEMKEKFGKDKYLTMLQGNQEADKLAAQAQQQNEPTMPVVSVMDQQFVPLAVPATGNNETKTKRMSEDMQRSLQWTTRNSSRHAQAQSARAAQQEQANCCARQHMHRI